MTFTKVYHFSGREEMLRFIEFLDMVIILSILFDITVNTFPSLKKKNKVKPNKVLDYSFI